MDSPHSKHDQAVCQQPPPAVRFQPPITPTCIDLTLLTLRKSGHSQNRRPAASSRPATAAARHRGAARHTQPPLQASGGCISAVLGPILTVQTPTDAGKRALSIEAPPETAGLHPAPTLARQIQDIDRTAAQRDGRGARERGGGTERPRDKAGRARHDAHRRV